VDLDIAPPVADALAEAMNQNLDGVRGDFFADGVDGILERFLRYDTSSSSQKQLETI
jgi:hypothetical protein